MGHFCTEGNERVSERPIDESQSTQCNRDFRVIVGVFKVHGKRSIVEGLSIHSTLFTHMLYMGGPKLPSPLSHVYSY